MRLGLTVLREFIRTIYHELEIHESGAFERGTLLRKNITLEQRFSG
jgi:hypothetical protein